MQRVGVCPHCDKKQKKYNKTWGYGKIKVFRYSCECGKSFNFYVGPKSTWSIPKYTKNSTKFQKLSFLKKKIAQ